MYKYLITVLLAVLIAGISCAPKRSARLRKCSNETLYGTCIQSTFTISPQKRLPTTNQEMTAFCAKARETGLCVKEYTNKCLTPTGKRAMEVAMSGISQMVKRLCNSSEKQQEFLSNAKCGNAGIGDMRACLNNYKLALYSAKQVEASQRAPIFCCQFHIFRGCVKHGFDKVGTNVCPQKSRQYFAKIADGFKANVFDSLCSEYNVGSDKCSGVVVPQVKPPANRQAFLSTIREVIESVIVAQQ